MFKALLIASTILLASCSSQPPKAPTPFVVGEKKVIVSGCEKLRKEVIEWNKKHPNNEKVADC